MATAEQIRSLVDGFSMETTPATAAKVASFKTLLAAGTAVSVTFLPGSDWRDTVATSARLRTEGMVPVPHIAARSIPDEAMLDTYLAALQAEARVDRALIVGGGVSRPVGRFDRSMQLLETGLFEKYGIRRIGVAGHPEGTPDIPPAEVERALLDKAAYARATGAEMYLVTQFCFEAAPVAAWLERLRSIGVHLPVWIGVPGPATLRTLLRYAQECGIGPSMRVVTRQARNLAKLLTVQTPDALLAGLADRQALDPERRLRGIHVYAFGGFAKTSGWFGAVRDGRFALTRGGKGFALDDAAAAAAAS